MNNAKASPLTALCWRAAELVLKHGFNNKKEVKAGKGGEHKNGTKHTNAKDKRVEQWRLTAKQKEPIYTDRLYS